MRSSGHQHFQPLEWILLEKNRKVFPDGWSLKNPLRAGARCQGADLAGRSQINSSGTPWGYFRQVKKLAQLIRDIGLPVYSVSSF
jgi:hypothetical protein